MIDVFNDFEKTEYGRYKLPNLIAGNQVDVVVRLKVPPMTESAPLIKCRLAYDDNDTQSRKVSQHQLSLPVVNSSELQNYPFNEEVKARVVQLMVTRAKEEAIKNLDRGDITGTRQRLEDAKEKMMASGISFELIQPDIAEIDNLLDALERGENKSMRKNAHYQNYIKRLNR